jgi:ApeA N-terminal domain 1
MLANILEEHGLFWWGDEKVPDRQFAPDSCVAGTLRISEEGRIELELDGMLLHKRGPWAILSEQGAPLDRGICGKLKTTDRCVYLSQVHRSGGSVKTAGISFEKYFAQEALVGREILQPKDHPLCFGKLQLELRGFEEWLMLRSLETKRTRSTIRVKYRTPKKVIYPLANGELSIVYDVLGPMRGKHRDDELKLRELALLEYTPIKAISLEEMKTQYGLFSDLFILLTGSDYPLDWPTLVQRRGRKKSAWQLFFQRHPSTAEPPKLHECWTNFPRLREQFGAIFSTFREKREALGPGIYLYLGTRRAMNIYEEHRFVNLIWGLESLHRRKTGAAQESAGLKAKIERILSQVQKSADRRWLEYQLRDAAEPSLAERMSETLKSIPLGLEESEVRKFCEECAKKRNDISHFGGQRQSGDYRAFIIDLMRLSEALSYLYHALLLQEIGVDPEILKWYVYKGFRSFPIKHSFVEVGLLPKSALRSGE